MIRHFRNEIDHDVTIEIQTYKVGKNSVDALKMSMAGPDSDTEWEVSRMEAQVLYEMLGTALGWKK